MNGIIADIQRASVHDGPGLRTTVFCKGCPLHCQWCHNPECIDPKPQILRYPERCIGCGQCESGCFSGAQVVCGREMTVEEVLDEICRDRPYYGDGGGMTLSGGEPLFQADFSRELLAACRGEGISTAVETSLFAPWKTAEPVLRQCGLVMADLKVWDDNLHREVTGVSNQLILENLRRLDELGIPLVLRTPVIPGVNDTPEEIGAIAGFAQGLSHLRYYELLPYHPLGLQKAAAAGIEEPRYEIPSAETMGWLARAAGFPVRIAGKVVTTC